MIPNIGPQKIVGNEAEQARIRNLHPEWNDKMVRVAASTRGPIISDTCPNWPHASGGIWVMGLTENGKKCWV
jgi:hypothetical protein